VVSTAAQIHRGECAYLAPSQDDGNYGWVDITISEHEFLLGIGDPSVGGDTETRTSFEAQAGGSGEGDIDEWLAVADVIAADGRVSAEDYSDHDAIDWTAEGEPTDWG
jgi:hypothetical protein